LEFKLQHAWERWRLAGEPQTGKSDEPRNTRSTRKEGWNRSYYAVANLNCQRIGGVWPALSFRVFGVFRGLNFFRMN
jgi:hypothetical protein